MDSITHLSAAHTGAIVVAASHGGLYSAHVALAMGVRAAIFHDAGVGLESAGIAGLDLLEKQSVPGCAVLSGSALIGDARQMTDHGIIGHINQGAYELGCEVGMSVPTASRLLEGASLRPAVASRRGESRTALLERGPLPVWALDSASLVRPTDAHSVVVTGSHGQLLGGDQRSALKVTPVGAVFNDAGVDPEGPVGRLGVLEDLGVPAATVGTMSARIGDARSTYFDGIVSRINAPGQDLGATVGMRCRDFVEVVIEHRRRGQRS